MLQLFASKSHITGGQHNTSFSNEPTEITEANAEAFFRHDHTPIQFKDGYCKGENYECAMAIPFDIDNSHSDNPDDWVQPDDIANRLMEMGINFVIVASRNHLLQKDGKAPRPKFHVYLILSEPFTDSDTFVLLCEWCIRTFNADQKVKSKAQKLFGYGDNPHAFVNSWNEGQCVDIVLNEDDIAPVTPPTPEREGSTPIDPLDNPHQDSNTDFDWFADSGEWKKHLGDIEELGWRFIAKDDKILFQTPEGDHSPGQQDGNIKGGVAYIFSKASPPFENDKGYSIPQLFAGALFGDIGKGGLAMFAKRYLQSDPLGSTDDKILTGLAPLDNILVLIEPVTWEKYPAKKCMLQTIDSILSAAKSIGSPIVNPTGAIYYRMETHYAQFDERTLRRFLKAGASHSGIPHSVFRIAEFIKETMEQFWHDTEDENKVEEPTGAYINLKNGTLFFDREGLRFEVHSPERFIRHCLNFDYDPKATAPLWQKHLDRSLPHPDMQMYLAKCLALTFYGGRIEKAPIFYGQNDTGKSTTLNVFEAMVGSENVSAESLAALTKADYTGDYSRARLDGRLVNIASDISKMINDTGRAKILISRDRISARHPYGDLFDMKDNYARLMFAMNELPSQFFSDAALTKRVAIVPFDQQIRPEDIDTNFTENIIANELPGVLNWVITGLDQLLLTCRLDQPPCCKEVMERIRNENDPLAGWLEERRRCPGDTYDLALQDVYEDFEWYCRQNRHIAPSKKTFIVRLRDVGYRVERPNHHTPLRLYFAAPPSPEN